jgi:hypothetical protein
MNGYKDLVDKVRCGDPGASAELYRLFNGGLKYFMRRRGIRDVDDKVEEVLLATAMGIRNGELEDPNRLSAFILGIAHHLQRGRAGLAGHRGESGTDSADQAGACGSARTGT